MDSINPKCDSTEKYDQLYEENNQHDEMSSTESLSSNSSTLDMKKSSEKISTQDLISNQKAGLTLKVFLAATVAFLTNSFPSGFNLGVVNTPEAIFKQFFNHSLGGDSDESTIDDNQIAFLWSIAVSLLLVGAFVGCIFTGYLADSIGRRGLLLVNGLVCLVGVLLCGLSKYMQSVPAFLAGRLIVGLHTGIGSSLVPMYLIEVAPKSMATCMGTLHVIGLNGGLMIAQILGLDSFLGTYKQWQLMFVVSAVIISLGLVAICFCPESPAYLLVMKQQEERAIDVLKSIRGQTVEQLSDDISALRQELKNKQSSNLSFVQLLRHDKSFKSKLLIVCALHAGQQLTGVSAIFFYSTKTFQDVGMSASTSQYASIGCSTLNVLSVIVCLPLLRRYVSRHLLMVSSTATTVCLLIITISMTFNTYYEWLNYVTITSILVFIFFMAVGLGPIPYMIGSELFEKSSMAIGMSIGCFVNWFSNFSVSMTFPMIVLAINQYVFLIFLVFNILVFIFIYFKVPNTRKLNNSPAIIPNISSKLSC